MRRCINHPDRETSILCMKHDLAMCEECATCRDPELYCKHRTACPIWFEHKERIKEERRSGEERSGASGPGARVRNG
jgi:hypothetical protein